MFTNFGKDNNGYDKTLWELRNCLKAGKCSHIILHESGADNLADTSGDFDTLFSNTIDSSKSSDSVSVNDMSGFYLVHLAVILDKQQLVRELFPFFLKRSSRILFTVKNNFSVVYLAIVHGRTTILSDLMKMLEDLKSAYYIFKK